MTRRPDPLLHLSSTLLGLRLHLLRPGLRLHLLQPGQLHLCHLCPHLLELRQLPRTLHLQWVPSTASHPQLLPV